MPKNSSPKLFRVSSIGSSPAGAVEPNKDRTSNSLTSVGEIIVIEEIEGRNQVRTSVWMEWVVRADDENSAYDSHGQLTHFRTHCLPYCRTSLWKNLSLLPSLKLPEVADRDRWKNGGKGYHLVSRVENHAAGHTRASTAAGGGNDTSVYPVPEFAPVGNFSQPL